jgi:hypothetical protein
MSKWVDYDPVTGLHETNQTHWDDDNKVIVNKVQDVGALLDRNQNMRNAGATDGGIKKGLWWYCSIPMVIQYELLSKYGLNIHNKNHTDRIFDVINRDYPALKVTDKHHSRTRTSASARATQPKPGKSPNDSLPTKILTTS